MDKIIKSEGYHATRTENANKILKEKHFEPSTKENEWLGTGVYFFKYLGHAYWWASVGVNRKKETSILKATLEYNNSQLLDLDDPDRLSQLEAIVKAAVKRLNDSNKNVAAMQHKSVELSKKWNFACNLIRSIDSDIGIITYTFPTKDNKQYSGFQTTQKQICVSKDLIITAIEEVEV